MYGSTGARVRAYAQARVETRTHACTHGGMSQKQTRHACKKARTEARAALRCMHSVAPVQLCSTQAAGVWCCPWPLHCRRSIPKRRNCWLLCSRTHRGTREQAHTEARMEARTPGSKHAWKYAWNHALDCTRAQARTRNSCTARTNGTRACAARVRARVYACIHGSRHARTELCSAVGTAQNGTEWHGTEWDGMARHKMPRTQARAALWHI